MESDTNILIEILFEYLKWWQSLENGMWKSKNPFLLLFQLCSLEFPRFFQVERLHTCGGKEWNEQYELALGVFQQMQANIWSDVLMLTRPFC